MRTARQLATILAALMLLLLAGCGGPPSDIVEGAIKKDLNSQMGVNIGTLLEFEITNEYSREVEGEKVYFYDYAALVEYDPNLRVFINTDEQGVHTGTVAIVRRGDTWYRI